MHPEPNALGGRRSMRALFQPFFAFSHPLLDPYTSFAHRLAKSANPLAEGARGLTKGAQPLALHANGNYLLLGPEIEGVVVALDAVHLNEDDARRLMTIGDKALLP